jgi:hypothetical protein
MGQKRTNHRGPRFTVVRYGPKATKFCDAAYDTEGPQQCGLPHKNCYHLGVIGIEAAAWASIARSSGINAP